MSDLEKKFDTAMLGLYQRARDEAGYHATKFFQMLSERRGVSTARYLINQTKPSEGYTRLYELCRLDLSVEALIFDNAEWHSLFTSDEVDRAKARLNQYHYFQKKRR